GVFKIAVPVVAHHEVRTVVVVQYSGETLNWLSIEEWRHDAVDRGGCELAAGRGSRSERVGWQNGASFQLVSSMYLVRGQGQCAGDDELADLACKHSHPV